MRVGPLSGSLTQKANAMYQKFWLLPGNAVEQGSSTETGRNMVQSERYRKTKLTIGKLMPHGESFNGLLSYK
jgi:hypothetical protein